MPIYEYHCPECDNLFEEWCQHIDDHKSAACPLCGKPAGRIISHTSFALKGEGWYVTEYGSKKGIKEADSTGADGAKGPKTSDTSTSPATPPSSPATPPSSSAQGASTTPSAAS